MVDSRLRPKSSMSAGQASFRLPLPRLYECFVEVVAPDPDAGSGPTIKRFHPEGFQEKDELLAQIPTFCFPCRTDSPGVQYFTFVLTDIDGKFRFGFCRYPAHAPSCICIVSYAPWFEMFYEVLNNISGADIRGEHDMVTSLLDALRDCSIPDVGSSFTVTAKCNNNSKDFKYDVPDTTKLPTIPENRNLTDYFAVITPEIMVQLFVSMLFERRILVTSKKLSLVTAIVHGSVSLLYPMQWQHIFVPVLPPKLLDYCCAPMPFLLGVHSSMMDAVRQMPLDEVVILDADKNEITSPFDDMNIFPPEVSSKLTSKLKKLDRALDDYVASQFLRALVKVIGGYRDALRFKESDGEEGGKIVFDEDSLMTSRSSSIRPFLEQIIHLQSFMQFIAGRLDLLNAGIDVGDVFEQEILTDSGDTSKWKFQHQQWMNKMKKGGGALKKSVGIQYAFLKGKANDMEVKSKMKAFYKGAKSGVKTGYKGAKHQFKEIKHQLKTKDGHNHLAPTPTNAVKRAGSMPASQLASTSISPSPFRHSMYSTLPSHRVHHGPKQIKKPGTPPPIPSRQHDLGVQRSASTNCIEAEDKDNIISEGDETRLDRADSQSAPAIADLIDLNMMSFEDTTSQSTNEEVQQLALENPRFVDEQFFIIDNEDVKLEHKSTNLLELSKSSSSSWVTFDDDIALKNVREPGVQQDSLPSPMVEIHYEDIFRRDSGEKYVMVSPGKNETEVGIEQLIGSETSIPVSENQVSILVSDGDSNSSLLSDTLSSMSAETRSLFAKSAVPHDVKPAASQFETCKPETVSTTTNPFRPELEAMNSEKKKRRPPPRPPPPGSTAGSLKRAPPVAVPPRNISASRTLPPRVNSPRPAPMKNQPTLTSNAFDEFKAKAQSNSNAPDTNDPFAALLKETRNGITQSLNKK